MLGMMYRAVPLVITMGGVAAVVDDNNPIFNQARTALVQYEINAMSRDLVYRTVGKNEKVTPANFSEYLRKNMSSQRDPAMDMWGSAYVLLKDQGNYTIISLGPDKKLGTEDDIRQTISAI